MAKFRSNRMVDKVQDARKSNVVITALQLFNAALTGIFAWNHLGGVFGDLTGDPVGDILVRVLAVILTVTTFDLAFHAWSSISKGEGLSLEQQATAKAGAAAGLWGSILASFAQVVLGQTKIPFPTDLLFFIAIVALVAVAVVLLLHVYWWNKFNDESFEAVERASLAVQMADIEGSRQSQRKDKNDADIIFQKAQAALELETSKMEQALQLEVMREEQMLKRQLATDRMEHQRAIAEQTRKNLMRSVYDSAAEIAEVQGAEASRAFRAEHGITDTPVPFPHAGVVQMAADGAKTPTSTEPIESTTVYDAVQNPDGSMRIVNEHPKQYVPATAVNGNGTTPNG